MNLKFWKRKPKPIPVYTKKTMTVHLNGKTRLYNDPDNTKRIHFRQRTLALVPAAFSIATAMFGEPVAFSFEEYHNIVNLVVMVGGFGMTGYGLRKMRNKVEQGDYNEMPFICPTWYTRVVFQYR